MKFAELASFPEDTEAARSVKLDAFEQHGFPAFAALGRLQVVEGPIDRRGMTDELLNRVMHEYARNEQDEYEGPSIFSKHILIFPLRQDIEP